LLARHRSPTNGLATAPNLEVGAPPLRIGGLPVKPARKLPQPAVIDYTDQTVSIDISRPEWDWSLVLFDRRFEVINKKAGALKPIAELDLKTGRIFVNWEHPVRAQMDERGFLRTALAWLLAKETAHGDADRMMDLALRLLSFATPE